MHGCLFIWAVMSPHPEGARHYCSKYVSTPTAPNLVGRGPRYEEMKMIGNKPSKTIKNPHSKRANVVAQDENAAAVDDQAANC